MSERGVFAVDRGIWDHPVFATEPFTEREAWQWLIGEAAFKQRVKRIGSSAISLVRGQVAHSLRFMAEAWQWEHTRVRRFLHRLKIATMIELKTEHSATVITICNYNKYQRVSLPDATPDETQNTTAIEQQRNKQEDTKTIETDSEAKASGAEAPPDPAIPEREFFLRGREVLGKGAGGLIGKLLKAKGGNVALARAALEQASQKQNPTEFVAAVCRGPPAVRATTVHQQKHAEGKAVLDALHEFNSSTGGREDSGLLRHDPGDGAESLRGGTGGNLIELSSGRDRSRG